MELNFSPTGTMGKQALMAFEQLLNSQNRQDISWAGQILCSIINNSSGMNSTDRLNLLNELGYQAAMCSEQTQLDILRKTILTDAFHRLDARL